MRQHHASPNVNGCGFYYKIRPIDVELPTLALKGLAVSKMLIRVFTEFERK